MRSGLSHPLQLQLRLSLAAVCTKEADPMPRGQFNELKTLVQLLGVQFDTDEQDAFATLISSHSKPPRIVLAHQLNRAGFAHSLVC